LENPDKIKWLGKNGRRRVLNEFTWDRIARKTLEIYERASNR
jgi:glycosyltransferase involved in cell wall biosynthesis